MNGPSDLPVNGRTVRSSGEWTNRLIFSGRKSQSMMTFRPACCTLAIDSRGRGEKRQRINEKDREARVRETPEEREREARLARRRQRPVILSGTYKHTKPLFSWHESVNDPSIYLAAFAPYDAFVTLVICNAM